MSLNILLLKGRHYLFISLFLFVIFLLLSESKGKTQCDDTNCREGNCINASCVCDKGWKGAACEHCTGRVRFLDDKQNLVIPDQYMPFGQGKRRCPGETLVDVEIFLFFTYIMHQVTVTAGENGQAFKLESEFDGIVFPKPFKICIESRVTD